MPDELWLKAGPCLDSGHETVTDFSSAHGNGGSPEEIAISLYYAVRDGIRYDPYRIDFSVEGLKASRIISQGHGYCVAKAGVLAAVCRAQGIPARIGFADVRNHLSTPRLRKQMGTDLFVWHGYTEIWLSGSWVKATPTFNKELCERFGVRPLDFDGRHDALFHASDTSGRRHMEYVKDHGVFHDIPLDAIVTASCEAYPALVERMAKGETVQGDFQKEARH